MNLTPDSVLFGYSLLVTAACAAPAAAKGQWIGIRYCVCECMSASVCLFVCLGQGGGWRAAMGELMDMYMRIVHVYVFICIVAQSSVLLAFVAVLSLCSSRLNPFNLLNSLLCCAYVGGYAGFKRGIGEIRVSCPPPQETPVIHLHVSV